MLFVVVFSCGVLLSLKVMWGAASGRPVAGKDERSAVNSYCKLPNLMSPAERLFFDALHEADAGHHWLFTKVPLADLAATRKGLDQSARRTAFNKIKAKHIDFVLCKPVTMEPVFAVELDDSSHRAKARQQRDAFIDQLAAATDLPLLHVQASSGYDRDQLRVRLERALNADDATARLVDKHSA